MTSQITLREFLMKERANTGLDRELVFLIEDIAMACRIISHTIRNGAFTGRLGATDDTNVQGETQKQIDVIANDIFVSHCRNCDRVAALVSEEVDEVYWLKSDPQPGDYMVYFDPLDGSSNLDVNLSVGSIFSVVELVESLDAADDNSVLRPGTEQICAGYSVFGPSTSFVITTGNGVNGFTHRQGTGEYRLTFPEMGIPRETKEFAVNASRYKFWDPALKRYVDECLEGEDGPRKKRFNMRWTASMVAEIHRILTRGGIFIYPKDADNADMGGKLRLMYEANPMGMIVEQAGGAASTGFGRILEVQPETHHQRVQVILGSADEVALLDSYHQTPEQS